MGSVRRIGPHDPQDLIVQIYRGSREDSGWRATLHALREFFDGEFAVLARYDFAAERGSILFTDGLDEAYFSSYNEYYYKLNPWLSSQRTLSEGEVVISDQVTPGTQLVRTEFYHDWLKPQNLFHTIRGGILKHESEMLYAAVGRSRKAGQFGEDEIRLYRDLLPHLQWAVSEYDFLSRIRALSSGSMAALDVLPFGIAILDTGGKPIFTNHTGRAILKDGDGLKLRLTGLRADRPEEHTQLHELLRQATEAANCKGAPFLATIAITRSSNQRPLSVSISPLPVQDTLFELDTPVVVVVFGDTQRAAASDEGTLSSFYGLTRAEARLAHQLAERCRLEEAADRLGISPSTARTHLKHIFSKTDTNRQAELVKLFLTGPLRIEPGTPRQ
jgi:DNA-binding CsgD family transcriptional regulator